tara:strand:+ start:43 stop:897 length:855 start_codon:yes stop_codon:yes gene_type:complete
MSWGVIGKIAATVAASVISGKLLEKDAPKQIGTGTSPALEPGPTAEYTDVEGSTVQPFGGFGDTNFTKPEPDPAGAEMMLQALAQAGINPEDLDQHGIAGMMAGGYLKRNAGGGTGIMDLLLQETFSPETLTAELPEVPLSPIQEWYQSLDPEIQEVLLAGGEKLGIAGLTRLVSGKKEKPGSLVSTQTLPGNSNRRRETLKIKPIAGSSFADGGGILDRPMFMPHGGAMHGRGGPKDDLIPVMASNGEYMLSKAAVDQAGDGSHAMGIARLEAFNNAGNRRYG